MEKLKTFFFFLHLLQQSYSDVHSISTYFIGSQGLNLPDYMERVTVDDVIILDYNSSMSLKVSCPEWLNSTQACMYWKNMIELAFENKHRMAKALQSAVQQFNLTASLSDINIYQAYARCDLHSNGTKKALLTHAFNGKDFLSLDMDSKTFIASVPQAVVYKRQREKDRYLLDFMVNFYKTTCFDYLKMFLQHTPQVNVTKVPEVRLLERHKAGYSVLTCHVTGFYPREVQVEWTGEDLQPVDEESSDVLPNGDGTYQTRRSVIRPEEKPEKHTYTCVVHHSSVPANITTTWVAEEDAGLAVWILLVCSLLVISFVVFIGLFLRLVFRTRCEHLLYRSVQRVPEYTEHKRPDFTDGL